MDSEFICVNAETQEFVPFAEYVRHVVTDAQRELRAFMRDNDIDPRDPLAVKAVELVEEKVTAVMYADHAMQKANFSAAKH